MSTLPHSYIHSQAESVRPGITQDTLDRAGVKYVDATEAEGLIGYKAEGLAIPYFTVGGRPLEVNGRPFCRVRIAKPKGDAKYLSPKHSGAQLYIPPSHRAAPVLYLTEGEFKAMSLCEAGLFAVGLGGITSALKDGRLIPALQNIIEKKAVEEVRFLGDADTPLIYDFAGEAVKLRQALPEHVRLVLPAVPFDGPKGIDDIRAGMPEGFADWLDALPSIEVKRGMMAGGLAFQRVAPVLPLIDYDDQERKIIRFAGRLDAASLDRFAGLIKKQFGISTTAFRKTVAQTGVCVDPPAELPDIYFDGRSYFRKNGTGFESIIREDAGLELRASGLSGIIGEGQTMSPLEVVLHKIQTEHRVTFAGPICGRPAGLHYENGITVLATRGPRIIEPAEGDQMPLVNFLADLFGRSAGDEYWQDQLQIFCGWLRHFRAALRKHDRHLPGQALALVGPADCGKSVLQSIITAAAGGREASCMLWLLGKTDFNRELWSAEHLTLDDDTLPPDRRNFTEVRDRLKKMAIAQLFPLHGKGRDAENFRPIWRVSLSANTDDESIHVLPPPDESFGDKISYLLCHRPPVPFHDGTEEARNAWYGGLMDALPAFLHAVENNAIEDRLRGSRFYVREFHHPEVLRAIYSAAPEADLGALLDEFMQQEVEPVEASAADLHERLNVRLGERRVRLVASSTRHLGWQLSRLSKLPSWKDRIEKRSVRVGGREINDSVNFWRILPVRTNAD